MIAPGEYLLPVGIVVSLNLYITFVLAYSPSNNIWDVGSHFLNKEIFYQDKWAVAVVAQW